MLRRQFSITAGQSPSVLAGHNGRHRLLRQRHQTHAYIQLLQYTAQYVNESATTWTEEILIQLLTVNAEIHCMFNDKSINRFIA